MENSQYLAHYQNKSFWQKLKRNVNRKSSNLIEVCLTAYYAFRDEHTPRWAKTVLAGALGYFIFPLDAIPDILPAVGYSDDITVLVAAIVTVGFNIREEHKDKARQVIRKWFFNL